MKEKILLIAGISLLSIGMYSIFANTYKQLYNYNGGLLNYVYANATPDAKHKYNDIKWEKDIDKVNIVLSKESVSMPKASVINIPPPPPRDSH